MIYNNIIELIGNTPVVKLNSFTDENIADIYVKLEKYEDYLNKESKKLLPDKIE